MTTLEILKIIRLAKTIEQDAVASRDLCNYLNSLDFEDIKYLQCLMYLGRDGDYDPELPIEQRLPEQIKYFNGRGWSSIDLEINQMTGKGNNLAKYLCDGMTLAGLI